MCARLLTGNETFSYSLSTPPSKKLSDFWSWYSSDLMNNTLRGAFAEFIIATAMDIRFSSAREDWSEYDLITDDNIKIEVKCSAYLQAWEQSKLSKIIFTCAPSQAFKNQQYDGISIRHSDVYVFCLHECQDREIADTLNLDQWIFYILPTKILDEKIGLQKTISLNSLLKLNPAKAHFHEIKKTIHDVLT